MGNRPSTTRPSSQGGALHSAAQDRRHQANTTRLVEDRDAGRSSARRALLSVRHSGMSGQWRRSTSNRQVIAQPEAGTPSATIEPALESAEQPVHSNGTDDHTQITGGGSSSRRYSTMSRFGSRLLPDTVMRSLLSSGEETPEEGQALRSGLSSRSRLSVYERRAPLASNESFSLAGSIRQRADSRHELREESPRRFGSEPNIVRDERRNRLSLHDQPSQSSNSGYMTSTSTIPNRTSTRLRRMRDSLPEQIGNLFGSSQERQAIQQASRVSTILPSRRALMDDSDNLLPPTSNSEQRLDLEDPSYEIDASEPETRNVLSPSRITSGMSTIRRFPHGLRSRSTRLIRRGEHPPLSQVLQLAAAAIAAQLSSHASNGPAGTRTFGGDAFDGNIQNFVQTLQDAASAQAGENFDLNASDGELPSVNFMRVFQFPNDENGTPISSQSQSNDSSGINTPLGGDRSVTLVLVGVRSMPNIQDSGNNENGTLSPSLETLLSLPFLPPANVLRNGSSGALFRRSDTRARSRRHSMTNFNNFPQQYESQRHYRTRAQTNRSLGDPVLSTPSRNSTTPISESPPGPHPPPSTPADIRSGQATPIRRPSSASAAQAPLLSNLNENNVPALSMNAAETPFNTARQRRRSDSEFARRPELSSGNSRRNGVVEPDRPPAGAGRSWLIYVVGTNVSPDHPAFTMPSLFTDNPSYEDMQMLSTLLGPAKPPVATQEDINTAGGLYRVVVRDGSIMALSQSDEHTLSMAYEDRCLVCLCEYQDSEEVRQLNTCHHVYHRECIDEWLTTGRNSCPMCRGQGVQEKAATPGMESGAATTSTPEPRTSAEVS